MKNTQNLNQNILSNNKAVKLEYNKILKVSNFFRGENTNNNKQPKKLSYDTKEIFYTSRIKESEIEPKLLLEKLPPAFHFKNTQNSNDSKTTTQTKNSSKEHKNNYNKLSINDSNETSPDCKNDMNIYKLKKNSEESKIINNFFIEEEINIQKYLQNKKSYTNNNKNNNDIIPLKIVTKTNNDFFGVQKSSTDYNKNILICNNINNNNHLKTDLSEYENLRPKNNLIDLGYNPKLYKNNLNKNTTFNISKGEKFRSSDRIKQNTFNSNNKKIKNIYNEVLNNSDLYRNNFRKGSDSEVYPTKLNYIEKKIMKKDERSGSYMNMVNYQDFLKVDPYYSPNVTNTNINTITNNNLTNEAKTIKESEGLRLSAKPFLHPIIPNRKNSQNSKEKMRVSKYIDKNIQNIKTINKMPKMSIITENILNGIKLDININKKNIIQNINNSRNKRIYLENINEGITYKYNNGFKYYFNLTYGNIFFLKEVQYHLAKGMSTSINAWNKIYNENHNYLNIITRLLNTPENHYTFIIEYPKGGENLYDIVNSIGLNDQKLIYHIISEIYKNILILKHDENEIIKDNQNIPFCLCDLFLTINEELKIMPPVIRKIPINASKIFNNNKNKKDNYICCNICECKKNLENLIKLLNIQKTNISFFSLGLSILQIITQNFLFKLKSYNIIIKQKHKFKCCLVHSLLNIEDECCNKINDLLLINFLSQYDNKLINFIHQCTRFEEIKNYPNSDFIDCYYMMEKTLDLSMEEILSIITYNDNNYISLDNFLKNFKLLFNEMKFNKDDFKSLLHENKVIHAIKRSFNIDKKELKNKIYKIMDNEDNDELYERDDFYQNDIYANSGRCFFNGSSLKVIDNNNNNNNNKIKTIINDNDNKRNGFHYNKNLVIFKNYKSNEKNS